MNKHIRNFDVRVKILPRLDGPAAIAYALALPTAHINLTYMEETGRIYGRSYRRTAESGTKALRDIGRAQEKGMNVYLNYNDVVPLHAAHVKAKKNEVLFCHFLHVDAEPDKTLTGEAFDADKAALLARIEADAKPPTIIVDSGNGLQCFWAIEPTNDVAAVEARNIALAQKWQGDHCQDTCHVMRLPYTINYANAKKIARGRPAQTQATVVRNDGDLGLFYSLDDFPVASDVVQEPQSTRWQAPLDVVDIEMPDDDVDLSRIDDADFMALIVKGAADGADRSKMVYTVACTMRRNYGYSDGEIVAVVIDPMYGISDHIHDAVKANGRTLEAQAARIIADMNAQGVERGNVNAADDFKDDAAAEEISDAEMARRKAQTEQRRKLKEAQAEPETWQSLRERWVYVGQQKRFVRVHDAKLWDVEAFSKYFAHIDVPDKRRGDNIANFIFSRPRGQALPLFDTFTYRPGLPQNVNGALNLYTPTDIIAVQGDTDLWNSHLEFLFPDDEDRDLLQNWCGWVLQNIAKKPKHALVIAGEIQGTGKSFIGDVMERLIGKQNTTPIDQTMLELDHNGWALSTKMIICEEVRATGANGRDAISKKLHRGITQPRLTVDEKNMPPVTIDDVMAYLLFTNKLDAIPMDNSDRRYLILRTLAMLQTRSYYCNLFDTILDGPKAPQMLGAIMWELLHRDLKGYTAQAAAPFTAAKGEMIEAALPDIEHWMVQHADERPLNLRVVTIEEMIGVLPRRMHRTARLEWMVGDVLRRRFKGVAHKHSVRPWGRDSDQVRVWSINGDPPDKLVEAYRETHRKPGKDNDFTP